MNSDFLNFSFDFTSYRRTVNGEEVALHCHHYNARLQGTIENAGLIDGKHIIRSSAETVFSAFIERIVRRKDPEPLKWQKIATLYKYLGFGVLDFSGIADGAVVSGSSHFVQGWQVGFEKRNTPVCTFTEGFLQAAFNIVRGEEVSVRESRCMIEGHSCCAFDVSPSREDKPEKLNRSDQQKTLSEHGLNVTYLTCDNINESKIIQAIERMPIVGDESGLIPLFNVYLASMPSQFYSLVSCKFLEAMSAINLQPAAEKLLRFCGEVCGLHTFRGIMESAEWESLISSHIKRPEDNLFAIIAISNVFGWGNWHITKLLPDLFLKLESMNGYEAVGYFSLQQDVAERPMCHMLNGVAAGIMELVYGTGSLEDRFGLFGSSEKNCLCRGDHFCGFEVTRNHQ